MTFTVEQKSQLAKLMATENITVEHRKTKTAKFDPQNRVLICPIWKDMSGSLYDLLLGHEVGHARYTPAEGWHDVVTDKTKQGGFKSFINVVEDARIEKKIQRKFPGLKLSFKNGYAELMKRDFFGLNDRDINDMAFIDRLNVYSKSQWTLPVRFNDTELKFIEQVQNAETWDDVMAVTNAIYEYSKDEQAELESNDFEYSQFGDDDYDSEDYDSPDTESDNDSNGDGESDSDNDGDSDGEKTDKSKESKSDSENETNVDSEGPKDQLNRHKNSQESIEDQFTPKCETDENYRRNEILLVDDQCKEYRYLNLPTPVMYNIITPAKRVHQQITEFYDSEIARGALSNDEVRKSVNEFKSKNERYIGLLAKEFEMRKAANVFSKSKLSDTGDIDVNKLATYRFDDNIFRKIMLTPKGKSHGLVLLLDKSGSMSENMAGSIEQVLVLAMFCRKVNIPFVVYGFGNSYDAHYADLGFDRANVEDRQRYKELDTASFKKELNCVSFSDVRLREYINSKMSNVEFNNAVRNLIILKSSYEQSSRGYFSRIRRPMSEDLSNTPLTQAVYATAFIMNHFKKANRLDVTNLVIVHDGDADYTNDYYTEKAYIDENGDMQVKAMDRNIDVHDFNVFIRDPKIKWQKQYKHHSEMNHVIIEWFKKFTGSKVFGFFLVPTRTSTVKNALYYHYVKKGEKSIQDLYNEDRYNVQSNWKQKQTEVLKKFRDEKFLISDIGEYDAFYLVSGGEDLKTEDDSLQIDGKFTAGKLKNAFAKMNKKKALNRILVSKFIQGIAS